MTTKQKKRLGGIALLLLCVGIVIGGFIYRKMLKENYVLGVARVYRFSGRGGWRYMDFTMEVNGKKYNGSSPYKDSDFAPGGLREIRGKSFPVIYHPDYPSINSLLILPSEFKEAGLPFPDSLKWLLPYLEKIRK